VTRVGLEPTIPLFGLPKTKCAVDCAVLVNDVVLRVAIQGVSRLVDITAGGDFLGLCDQKSSYEHVPDFGRLRSYGHF
jgi:hypothetical protein